MADRYTLPAKMGGYECEIIWRSSALVTGVEVAKVRYNIDTLDGFEVTAEVLSSWLTPVKPPLPPEPPDGSVVRLTAKGPLFARHDDGPPGNEWPGGRRWEGYGPDGKLLRITWSQVCGMATDETHVLIRDPFAEPVQLPWRRTGFEVDVSGAMVEVVIPRAEDGGSTLVGRTLARDFCRAVWAAANQVDKAGETT